MTLFKSLGVVMHKIQAKISKITHLMSNLMRTAQRHPIIFQEFLKTPETYSVEKYH